jgi:hypothetical protein
MFYHIKSVASKKTHVTTKQYFELKQGAALSYHPLYTTHFGGTPIFALRKLRDSATSAPRPLVNRFSRIASVDQDASEKLLSSMVSSLVNNYSYNTLYYYIKKLFWLVPVPKHKQLLYVLRALIKFCYRGAPHLQGLSVILRGKLAATGNKRKSTFPVLVGKGLSSKVETSQQTDFRLLRTPVGVIGVTSILTYTH